MSGAFGQQIKEETIDGYLLTGPGENIVPATLMQLASIPGFVQLFGPYVFKNDQQRWADYNRLDWSIRQLPVINVYESGSENKDSDQAFLRGTVTIQVYWPPNFRRGDTRRVEAAFKGSIENFFNSKYTAQMLDEIYFHTRPMKVYGLNEYGKTLTWSPDVTGILEVDKEVPVTILTANYRIDLRAWNRALVFMNRTKGEPFKETLDDLAVIGGIDTSFTQAADNEYQSSYQGKDNEGSVWVNVNDEIDL